MSRMMSNKNINDVREILGVESGSLLERTNSSDKKLSPVVEALNAKKEKERKEKKNEKKTIKGKVTRLELIHKEINHTL